MKKILLMFVLAVLAATLPVGATRRALVIGLGEQLDPSWGTIHGDNDVDYAVKFLKSQGYTDIRTLKNRQATKAGIVAAFSSLTEACGQNDKVYIHYSGHGQLMTDLDGDEAEKWSGSHANWDESWVPYDAFMSYCDRDHGDKHLCDDEIALLLSGIRQKIGRGGELIVVIDSCHSGDATNAAEAADDDEEEQEFVRGVSIKFNIPRPATPPARNNVQENWLTISACQPYQLSSEIKGLKVGKLTYALYCLGSKTLALGRADLEAALADFMEKHRSRTPQTPMVTGRK